MSDIFKARVVETDVAENMAIAHHLMESGTYVETDKVGVTFDGGTSLAAGLDVLTEKLAFVFEGLDVSVLKDRLAEQATAQGMSGATWTPGEGLSGVWSVDANLGERSYNASSDTVEQAVESASITVEIETEGQRVPLSVDVGIARIDAGLTRLSDGTVVGVDGSIETSIASGSMDVALDSEGRIVNVTGSVDVNALQAEGSVQLENGDIVGTSGLLSGTMGIANMSGLVDAVRQPDGSTQVNTSVSVGAEKLGVTGDVTVDYGFSIKEYTLPSKDLVDSIDQTWTAFRNGDTSDVAGNVGVTRGEYIELVADRMIWQGTSLEEASGHIQQEMSTLEQTGQEFDRASYEASVGLTVDAPTALVLLAKDLSNSGHYISGMSQMYDAFRAQTHTEDIASEFTDVNGELLSRYRIAPEVRLSATLGEMDGILYGEMAYSDGDTIYDTLAGYVGAHGMGEYVLIGEGDTVGIDGTAFS